MYNELTKQSGRKTEKEDIYRNINNWPNFEREKEREAEREREREREREKQTEREKEKQTDRQTQREREREPLKYYFFLWLFVVCLYFYLNGCISFLAAEFLPLFLFHFFPFISALLLDQSKFMFNFFSLIFTLYISVI